MRVAALGSGSKGNAILVCQDDMLVLVDCGFSLVETRRRMARLGCSPEDLSAILLTHEHSDHIKGVPVLARATGVPVYATAGTWRGLSPAHVRGVRQETLRHGVCLDLGALQVMPVAVPHDAREPVQFVLQAAGRKLGILTDLGSVTEALSHAYSACHALLLESNHDPHMLARGSYPQALKQRVASNQGHLSNAQAAAFLDSLELHALQHLVLCHMSEKNNSHARVEAAFETAKLQPRTSMQIACQTEGFCWLSID